MVAYSFQSRFDEKIRKGSKTSTSRPVGRRRHAHVGDSLQLYSGMRTKSCKKLLTPDPVCTSVHALRLDEGRVGSQKGKLFVWVDGYSLRGRSLDAFVASEGFSSRSELRDFFRTQYGLPWSGINIRWRPA